MLAKGRVIGGLVGGTVRINAWLLYKNAVREMGFNKDTVKVGMNEGDPSGPRVYLDKFLYSKSLETVALCEDEIVGTLSLRDAGETPAEG